MSTGVPAGRDLRAELAELAQQLPVLPDFLVHLGPGRRFRAQAPRNQPGAGQRLSWLSAEHASALGPVPYAQGYVSIENVASVVSWLAGQADDWGITRHGFSRRAAATADSRAGVPL
jgi:hypothetical protein